jgi:hypothetical protein
MFKQKYIKSSPTSPYLPDFKNELKRSWIAELVDRVLCSRKTTNRIMMAFAAVQLIFFGSLSVHCYYWHLSRMTEANSDRFAIFIIQVLPSLLALPISVGFMIWPLYIILGLSMTRTFYTLNTIEDHTCGLCELQQSLFTKIHENEFNTRMNAMHCGIGNRLPLEIKLMIEKECRVSLINTITTRTAALRWKSKIQPQFQPNWNRVTMLWSMYTGINERHRIPSFWSISMKRYWIFVFSRDAFLVAFSCLVRFSMITWMVLSLNSTKN